MLNSTTVAVLDRSLLVKRAVVRKIVARKTAK